MPNPNDDWRPINEVDSHVADAYLQNACFEDALPLYPRL